MKKITIILTTLLLFLFVYPILAADNLAKKLLGKILLQVESNGEAWYVNPDDLNKYYMGRPSDAFNLMESLGIGITNEDLKKIPIGIVKTQDFASLRDDDNDGLSNALEDAIGADSNNSDTDNDGYDDKTEIENNYSPLNSNKLPIDNEFTLINSGKIFLQVENAGQAWYINPNDNKRYFLNRPQDAFNIMRDLGLGITNENLNKITTSILSILPYPIQDPFPDPEPSPQPNGNIIDLAAEAIRSGDTNKVLSYFSPGMQNAIEYAIDSLGGDGRLALGNILSGSKLKSSTSVKKIYSTEINFGGYTKEVEFHVKKQEDGTWLISKL